MFQRHIFSVRTACQLLHSEILQQSLNIPKIMTLRMMEGEPLALPGLSVGIGVGEAAVYVSECVCVCSHAGDGGVEAGLSDTPEQ